ncbi:DUF3857 domain-containing transglutaminase family protein [Flagellimonas algicola]|uniref:DUF3857 domain-containing protein n=1 Tax=Flagellimonas algicola TaxID=2583815 RepID=A0ABY2WNF7_9FLAO|nr:DUF3857 domain-containing protein [Allomuricauda algicola]TMU56518.1 DUF3857 domain-containing protein [Allomuricauda algicola]
MRNALILPLLLLFFHLGNSQVSITPEPSWIIKEKHDANAQTPENGVSGGTHVLLYTEQIHMDREEIYIKSVSKAVEYSGIQNISSVVADYDPTYQKLRFHRIDVIRNGEVINRLRQEDIQTARRETNAENYIYDGTISAFFNIPDVRNGDIVLYSYSKKGFNPIQKGKFSTSFVLNSTQPIDKISAHAFSKDQLHYQLINTELEPIHKVKAGVNHYAWTQEDVPAILLEEQTPSWYVQNATVLVTEYDSWSDVIAWGRDVFTFEEPLSKELQDVVSEIRNTNKKEGDRIRAALAFVQNEVRYLAIHSGIGGYKPNPPNKVMEQRFGDCKDKSVLFSAMLNNMSIEAYPTLVNTSLRKILPTLPPSSKVFDHCIVKVVDQNGSTLWYDPTLTDQAGAFDNVYMPDYRYGLVLDQNMTAMDTISDFRNNLVETFSTFRLDEMGKGAELEVRTNYYDGEADFMRAIFRNNSNDVIAKELMAFYTETYGSTSSLAPPTIIDDAAKNQFALLERYKLDSIWRPSLENTNHINLSIYPTNLTSVLTMPSQLERTTPFALSYPMVRKQHVKIMLPEYIRAQAESVTINSDYFYYDFSSNYDSSDNILTLDYYYKNQDDHVPASGFDAFYKDMVQLDQQIGYFIISNKSGESSVDSIAYNLGTLIGYAMAALIPIGLVVLVIVIVMNRKKKKQG